MKTGKSQTAQSDSFQAAGRAMAEEDRKKASEFAGEAAGLHGPEDKALLTNLFQQAILYGRLSEITRTQRRMPALLKDVIIGAAKRKKPK